jgi:pyruvate dehydrogenase E1 component
VWSVTSYKELHRDALDCERWNTLHPEAKPRVSYVTAAFGEGPHVFVAVSDYVKMLPDSIARWLPGPLVALGTDGFGRSEDRAALRNFFEVDARYVALAALSALARDGHIKRDAPAKAIKELGIDPEKPNPATV